MRGLAVILMVIAHTTDAFLDPTFKNGDLWYGVDLLFGYVAPAFLFLSGVVLHTALEGGSERRRDRRMRRLIVRLLQLLLLGYWLQIPVLSLRRLLENPSPDLLARLFDANILQIIALSGLLALLLYRITGADHITGVYCITKADRITGTDRRTAIDTAGFRWATLLLALAITAATPWIWSSTSVAASLPLPLRAYFSPQPVATFPFFPYAAYYLFGLLAAKGLMRSSGPVSRAAIIGGVGVLLLVSGLLLDSLLHGIPPHNDFWGSSGQHVIFRLGGVAIIIAVGLFVDMMRGRPHEILCYIGRTSLAIYVVHLVLIYGSPMTMGMRYWFGGVLGGAFTPLGTIALSAAIVLLAVVAIRAWSYLRRERPKVALWTKRLAWGTFWGFFLLVS